MYTIIKGKEFDETLAINDLVSSLKAIIINTSNINTVTSRFDTTTSIQSKFSFLNEEFSIDSTLNKSKTRVKIEIFVSKDTNQGEQNSWILDSNFKKSDKEFYSILSLLKLIAPI